MWIFTAKGPKRSEGGGDDEGEGKVENVKRQGGESGRVEGAGGGSFRLPGFSFGFSQGNDQ